MINILLALALSAGTIPSDTSYLYRTVLVRAAPGDLAALIDLYQQRSAVDGRGSGSPWIIRHRQGDHWDLMLIYPMGSFAEYYSADQAARRERAAARSGMTDAAFSARTAALTAWREELFAGGPPPEVLGPTLEAGALYHIEMFIAVPGKRAELYLEREMENAYLAEIDRPQNMIFTRVAGAAWDLFTLGVHESLPSFAASDTVSVERQEVAARAAGFESVGTISTYLRSLIQRHNDTLARPLR